MSTPSTTIRANRIVSTHCLTLCRARARAHSSAARTASTELAATGVCASSTSLDGLADPSERNGAFEKSRDRHLVGRIEHRRRGATRPARGDPELERAEDLRPHRLEGEWPRRHRVEPPDTAASGKPLGMGQGVEDRQLHRGKPS